MTKIQGRISAQGRQATWSWTEQLLRRDTSSQATAKRTVRITCMVRLSLLTGNELWIVCYDTSSSRHRTKEFNTLVEERQLQTTGRNGRTFSHISESYGLSNVMFGESCIAMEETSDFGAADASVIVNLELTKLTTNDFKFFLLLLGFNNFETLWYHC